MNTSFITISGDDGATGAYVLLVRVSRDLSLAFGRYRGGRPISVPNGAYLYVGSARGRGATAIAGRLLRHATRSAGRPPHAIRDELAARLAAAGLAAPLPVAKRASWHVDYLLDEPAAEIAGVWAIRSAAPLETHLAAWLAAQPGVAPLAPGLGASDDPGRTHLLRTRI